MNPDDDKELALTWTDVHTATVGLARLLGALREGRGAWRGIVAIARGGLVPAAIVARELGVRTVETLCIASYDGRARGPVRVLTRPEAAIADGGEGWLMIDDLVDTGETAKAARALLPRAHFATLYAKPEGRPMVDTFVALVAQATWVHFPWDTDPAG